MTETPTTEQPSAPPPSQRRFLRSREDGVLGGVAGGLAAYFGIDATIVRIAFVALAVLGGAGLIAYAAALAFVPEDDGTGQPREGEGRAATIAGATILVVAGLIGLSDGLGWFFGPVVPGLLLVGLLAFLAYRLLEHRSGDRTPTAARVAGALLLGLAALVVAAVAFVGAAWAAAEGGGEVVAGLVIAIGVVMVVAAFVRPARWLAVPALVLALPLGVVAAADIDADGGIGERTHRPAQLSDVPADGYELGVGELVVDLRRLQWPAHRPVELDVEIGVGHALVLVPEGTCVRATGDVGAGFIGVLGEESGGVDLSYAGGSAQPRGVHPRLVLDAQLGLGAVEVRHDDWDGYERGPRGGHDAAIGPELADDGCAGDVR